MTDHSPIVPEQLALEGDNGHTKIAYIEIEDGEVSICTRDSYGNDGVPVEVWNNCVLRYDIASGPCVLDIEKLRQDLAEGGRLSTHIDTIIAGHQVARDPNGNRKGRFTEAAKEADFNLSFALDQGDYVDSTWAVWDERDWVDSEARSLITAATTDAEIDAYLDRVRETAADDRIILQGDAREHLIELRDRKIENEEA